MTPSTLFNGIRQSVVDIRGLQSDLLRQARQNQSVVQNGRAHGGATATNDHTQKERISQTATAENIKDITIEPANTSSTGVPSGFDFNYLERTLHRIRLGNLLSSSKLNLDQRQRGVQNGVAEGLDFDGNPSVVTNNLTQDSGVESQSATSTVRVNIRANRDPETQSAARSRDTEVFIEDSLVDAGTFAIQDQGTSLEDASIQSGRANGGVVNNTLNQIANGVQSNDSNMENTIDLRQTGPESELSPRSTTKVVNIENDIVRNYGSAVQTQAFIQIAEAGVDENGNPTENGGTVNNVAIQIANLLEDTTATNRTNVMA